MNTCDMNLDLVAQAQSGEAPALSALRRLLRNQPDVWHQVRDRTRRPRQPCLN
jgi:hypothetical protein